MKSGDKDRLDAGMHFLHAGMNGGVPPKFKSLISSKCESIDHVAGTLLEGSLSHHSHRAKDLDDTHSYGLSVNVDYAKLYAFSTNSEKSGLVDDDIMMRYTRAHNKMSCFQEGSFETPEEALAHMAKLETFLAYVLREQGAEGAFLRGNAAKPKLIDSDRASTQTASQAVRTARLAITLLKLQEQDSFTFNEVVGVLVPYLFEAMPFEYERKEGMDMNIRHVQFVFDRDIGVFHVFEDEDGGPAFIRHWKYDKDPEISTKDVFEGPATQEDFNSAFVGWLAPAARERELIDDTTLAQMTDPNCTQIVNGLPLDAFVDLINSPNEARKQVAAFVPPHPAP